MKCLEFKRLALSEPDSSERNFIEHSLHCPPCLKYVKGIRKMDSALTRSLDVGVPDELMARLQLNQVMESEQQQKSNFKLYAIAASCAGIIFMAGFMLKSYFGVNQQVDIDAQVLLTEVMEHVRHDAVTPVWSAEKANRTTKALLVNYDHNLELNEMANLQFSRICKMGRYKGLHGGLETPNGQITFIYIKGEPVVDVLDVRYQDYIARVKPVRGGNLFIVSSNSQAIQLAEQQLDTAMRWQS